MSRNISDVKFINFKALVRYQMYKRGMTMRMMADIFNIQEHYCEELLAGKHADYRSKQIIKEIYIYFVKERRA